MKTEIESNGNQSKVTMRENTIREFALCNEMKQFLI